MGCGRESVRQASLTHPSGSQESSQESVERQQGEALGSGLQPRKYREARRGPWQLPRYPVLIPSVGRHAQVRKDEMGVSLAVGTRGQIQ